MNEEAKRLYTNSKMGEETMRSLCLLCGDDVEKKSHNLCLPCNEQDKKRKARKRNRRGELELAISGHDTGPATTEEWDDIQRDKLDTFRREQ